jgi:acetylornithine deacetylase/succinyl-diaminopimelate desuccinylase-like protein
VNEGSGDRIELAGRVLYLCATAEKATAPFIVRVDGKSGHASMPGIADNALVRAGRLLERLGSFAPSRRLGPETEALLAALLGEAGAPATAVERVRALSPAAAAMVEPMLAATVAPTQIAGSPRVNVIPGSCEVVCDCRLLPGQEQSEVEAELRAHLAGSDYELAWSPPNGGTRSALGTPLWDACASFVDAEEPGAELVPILLPGFTDSHYLREAFGTIAYGFLPMRAMHPQLAATLIHSADERMHVEDLELGVRFLVHAARELLG